MHCSEKCSAIKIDSAISDIPQEVAWQVGFTLKATVEFVSDSGLKPKTIISRLIQKHGDRLTYNIDSLESISAGW